MDLFPQVEPTLPFDLPAQCHAQWNEALQGFDIDVPHGKLFYAANFFSQKISDRCVAYFQENEQGDWRTMDWRSIEQDALAKVKFKHMQWQHDSVNMYGKTCYLPRFSAWYGDNDKPYTYSGLTLQPKPWNKGLLYIKQQIEQASGYVFNSVLVNWYRDGEDYINWHTDAEKELGKNPTIASVNFGEPRDFVLRTNDKKIKIKLPLKHGTFLLMSGELQHHWQHAVPKRKRVQHSRFNLTFRTII